MPAFGIDLTNPNINIVHTTPRNEPRGIIEREPPREHLENFVRNALDNVRNFAQPRRRIPVTNITPVRTLARGGNFEIENGVIHPLEQVDLNTGDIGDKVTTLEEVKTLPKGYIYELAKENRALTPKEFEMCALTVNNPSKLKLIDFFISKLKILPEEYPQKDITGMIFASICIPKDEFGVGINVKNTISTNPWTNLNINDERIILEINPIIELAREYDIVANLQVIVSGINNIKIKDIVIEINSLQKTQTTEMVWDNNLEAYIFKSPLNMLFWLCNPFNSTTKLKLRVDLPMESQVKILKNIKIDYTYTCYIIADHRCRDALIALSRKIIYKAGGRVGEFTFKNEGRLPRSFPVILPP